MVDTNDSDNIIFADEIKKRLKEKRREVEEEKAQFAKKKEACRYCGQKATYYAITKDCEKVPFCKSCLDEAKGMPWLASTEKITF